MNLPKDHQKDFIMDRKLLLLLIFVCMLSPAAITAEYSIPGWGKAEWGMTHSELKKHYDLNPWEPGSTPTCKSKKKIRIWGHDFAMAFYFDDRSANGKLYKITLVHFDHEKGDTTWLHSIKDMLVEKYGTPESFEAKEKEKIALWFKSDGRLKLTTLTGRTIMCAMEYMSVSLEGNKL
jgi:hypothetical protein